MIPDYMAEVVVARCWRTGYSAPRQDRFGSCWEPFDPHLLYSALVNVAWPVDGPMRAECRAYPFHEPPAADCHCGIYGRLPDYALAGPPWRDFPGVGVVGFTAVWGRACEGPKGFRTEFARPLSLVRGLLYDQFFHAGEPGTDALAAGKRYGIPVCGSIAEAYEAARDLVVMACR